MRIYAEIMSIIHDKYVVVKEGHDPHLSWKDHRKIKLASDYQ
jgi:hypothetical protein